MALDPPAKPQPPTPSAIHPAQEIEQPGPPEKPLSPPAPALPKPDPSRPQQNCKPPPSNRRSSYSGQDRSGTLITMMTIDLDANRIALSSPQGAPVRGDVSTDLSPGLYTLHVDRMRERWVFDAGQVKPGLRFCTLLDGARPFDLVYPEEFYLVAQHGFQPSGPETFQAVKKRIEKAVSDQDFAGAFRVLDFLGEVDLYDVLDEIWIDEPGVINALLLNTEKVRDTRQFDDIMRLVRALETFAVAKKNLYIDAFDKCYVHPTSFGKSEENDERIKEGKSTTKLVFTYDLKPPRAVMIYADDIYDTQEKIDEPPQYGEMALLYPRYCTAGSTPRMHAAKKAKIQEIETQNIEFFKTAYSAIDQLFTFFSLAQGLMIRTLPGPRTGPRSGSRSPRSRQSTSDAFDAESPQSGCN